MAIINHLRTQDYSNRASGKTKKNPSAGTTIADESKDSKLAEDTGGSKDSKLAEDTGGSSSVDEYLKLLNGSGSYDDSYWTKISNALLSNNNYSRSKADAHEKYYTDLVADYKSQNPLETDWGKAIMAQYGLDGDSAANAELADSASSNGGNIDSYAEANARRQKLSYLNSGINAVNDASNQRFSNMLSALEKMGVNTANLLGIGTENVASAMGAAQDRYAQDTDSTIAYNEMLQNLAPYYLSSDSSSSAASSLTATDRANLRKQLEKAYASGGETGLIQEGEKLLADYSNDSSIDSLIEQYYQIITGGSGASGSEASQSEWYSIPEFRQYFEDAEDNQGITGLPSWVQKKLREEAEEKGTTAAKYAKGILTGDYEYPSWLKQAPNADQ